MPQDKKNKKARRTVEEINAEMERRLVEFRDDYVYNPDPRVHYALMRTLLEREPDLGKRTMIRLSFHTRS